MVRSQSSATPFINHPKTYNFVSIPTHALLSASENVHVNIDVLDGKVQFVFNRGRSLTEERWVLGLCTCEQANVLLYLSFYFYCISISIVFVFLLYLYFCDREKLSGPGLDMRETNHPLVLLCTGVTLMVSCTSCDHASFSPCT